MFASNGVTAKCRAVFGRRLTDSDYVQLAAKENVPQVCDYLKTTPRYENELSATNSVAIHRGQLEALLGRAAFEIYESFRKFDYTKSRGYFDFIVERLEIGQIVSAIGAVYAGGADEYIAALPMYISRYTKTDLPALGKAKNLSEVIPLLEGTTYIKVLREPLINAAQSGRLDIGEIERRLINDYYFRLLKYAEESFHGSEKKEFKRAVLRSIDMENVVTLYRRARFSAPPENIKDTLIPFRYKLRDDVIEELAAEKDIDALEKRLDKIGYRADGENATVEQLTERISQKFYEKTLHLSSHASVAYFALTESLWTELRNIRTVVEAVRYGLNGAEIMKMLVI